MSVALHDYASWQHPFREQRIYIRAAIIQSLATEALRSLKAQRVAEIGGILWGTRPSGPNEPVVIDDAEFVPSEGRLYNTTATDSINLARTLRSRKPGSDVSCVGYFRSCIHDDLRLTVRDQELIEKEIRDSDAVFLVVKPFDIGVCMAAFFFWEDGHLQTDVSDLEVPFVVTETSKVPERFKLKEAVTPDAVKTATPETGALPFIEKSSLAASEPQTLPNKAVPKPPIIPNGQPEAPRAHFPSNGYSPVPKATESAEASESAPEASEWVPEIGEPAWWASWPLLNAVLGLVLVVLAGTLTYWLWSGSRLRNPAANSLIGLRVFRAPDGQLNVSWNGNAPLVANAQRGKLTINDGTLSREFPLDSSQLRSSRILYMPSGADVQFRLDVYSNDNRPVTQSVRVLSSDLASGRNGPFVTAPALDTRTGQSKVAEKRDNPAAKLKSHGRSGAIAKTNSQQSAAVSRVNVDLPALKPEPSPDARKLARSLPPPPSPVVRTPKNSNPVLSPRQAEVPNSSPMVALVDGKKRAIYVPPQPLEKVMPDMSSLTGVTIDRSIQIAVRVVVDATGHVVEAGLSDADFNTNSALAHAAISAARQWVFQPATLDGRVTSAEHIIVFKFHP